MSLPQIAGLELQEMIGRGSCGAVYRAVRSDTRESCAVKVFSSVAINRKVLAIAMRGLRQMPEHPGLQRPLVFDFEGSPYFCAAPLVGFGSRNSRGKETWETPTLESCCGRTPPDEAWRYIYEVCDAMAWLHRNNLVHCNLKPRNVLIEDDQASATKINDFVQGWIGGVHHVETTDHFMYLAPEQAENPDALATQGAGWDVYSFGVLAYRVLTGRFPRAAEAYETQRDRQQHMGGMVPMADNGSILQAVRSQPQISWPDPPASKWDARRKQIIERCLALDPKVRSPDLREVMREFEKLEADYLLEDARDQAGSEKRRHATRALALRAAAVLLGIILVSGIAAGAWYGLGRWRHWRGTAAATTALERRHREEMETRDLRIKELTGRLDEAREEKRLANANLALSQEAADRFLTQLLDMPGGTGVEAEISGKQLDDALAFYESERRRLKDGEDFLPERARNYFNTAQILLRRHEREGASENLEKARSAAELLLRKEPGHGDTPRRQALLGRACRRLGVLRAEESRRGEAMNLLKQAVASLTPAFDADPANRATRLECAAAWYELGRRSRRDGLAAEAADALARVPGLLNVKMAAGGLTLDEQFLLARMRIEQGLAQRDSGSTDQAMRSLFDAMEEMVRLVEKQKSSSQRDEMALALAEAYIEFGDIVAGKLGGNDAKDSHAEAAALLAELVRVHPQWGEARFLLGRSYGAMANLERDLGNPAEAVRRATLASETLAELAKLQPANMRYLTEMAREKGHLAQLLCDLGKAKESIPVAEDAIAALEGTAKGGAAVDAIDRKSRGVLLAQLYGVLGHSGEVAKDSKLAKSSFGRATEQWERVKSQHGDDEVIEHGLNWTKDRLAKLK